MDAPGFFDQHSSAIEQRLATGLYQLGLAVKHQERQQALAAGLSPTQARILALLNAQGPTTSTEVSNALGVSLPTVSDSVHALVAKELVDRQGGASHHRATLLTLTRAGRAEARRVMSWPDFLAPALGSLSDSQQASLLTMLGSMLRALQEDGQIPAQRMCLTCTFFRPHAHEGGYPHHCALVDAPMRPSHLRLVCDEHEMASGEAQITQWQQFLRQAV